MKKREKGREKAGREKEIWFKAKCYGWGWYPCSWQGWLVLFIWFILFVPLVARMEDNWLGNFILILASVFLLIYVCYRKGEKPGWRWGCKK